MCWSGQASTIIATLGFTGSMLEFRKMVKHKQGFRDTYGLRGITILYFTLMEILQAVNYYTLYTPGQLNSLFALLGYVHISLQPFFVVVCSLTMIPVERRKRWIKPSIIFSSTCCLIMLSRLIIDDRLPGCFANRCIPVTQMDDLMNVLIHFKKTVGCSVAGKFYSYRGEWHIAWQWALNACSYLHYAYYLSVFIFPCFFGVFVTVLAYTVAGPISAILSSNNPDEFAAVWCLFSIACISSIKIPAWERMCTVNHSSWKESWDTWSDTITKIHKSFRQAQNTTVLKQLTFKEQ